MNLFKNIVKETLLEINRESVFADIRAINQMSRTDIEMVCRTACQSAYLGGNTVLCRVLTKYMVYADSTDIGLTPHLCLQGVWEAWVTQIFAKHIEKGSYCVDVGANNGYFSLLMIDLAGENGRLLAVEPNPKTAEMLSQTLSVNGFLNRSVVSAKAVADTNGATVKLVVPKGFVGGASIVKEQSPSDEIFEVETATLDELTKDWERVDFVKIDAEGAEEAIWHGMRETRRKNRNITVVMEFTGFLYKNPRAFLEQIVADGFKLRYIDYDSHIKDASVEECIENTLVSHWMLYLTRR